MEDCAPVSVGIPTFGRGNKVVGVIERIAKCRPRPAEIIVHVDNAAEAVFYGMDNVRILASKHRVGPGGGRHRCLMAAREAFFVSFDDDSYPVDDDFFENVIKAFSRYPNAAVLAAVVTHPWETMKAASEFYKPAAGYIGCGHALRVEAYRAVQGYVDRPYAYGVEEEDLALQLHAAGWDMVRCHSLRVYHDTILAHHRNPEVVASFIQNVALAAFLRYPWRLWPIGAFQVANKIRDTLWRRRFRGVVTGVLGTPALLWHFRGQRKALQARMVRSYLTQRRADYRAKRSDG